MLMNTSLSWKVSAPVSHDRSYIQSTHGSAVAQLIGLQPGLPLDTNQKGPQIQWAENEREVLNSILISEGSSLQPSESLVLRRIGWRMRVNSIYNFDAYKELLANNPAELPALRKSISMRVTDFFKDPHFFIALEHIVFPRLAQNARKEGIHSLITNCGTGEEAYSVAMLFEYLKKEHRIVTPLKIIACDKDQDALQKANDGYYPHLITADLAPSCLNMFFNATVEGYKIGQELQNLVHFESEDIEHPSINAKIDLLIASQPLLFKSDDVRNKLIETFYKRIRPGGFLVLNPLSHSDHVLSLFNEVDLQLGIYERKDDQKKISPPLQPKEERNKDTIEHLENELLATKERLTSTISDYEHSHVELVDINHGLKTSVDQLVFEKDQIDAERNSLQTMVGHIMKANKHLKSQNKQLQVMNQEWGDIVSSCGIGILLLNAQLCVKLFTSDIAQIFDINKMDIGRPLSDLKSPFQWNITEAANSVLRTRTSIEREYVSQKDQWYRIKLSPLINQDAVTGILFSFIDVTESKRENEWDRFRASILNQFEDAVIVTNRSGQVTYVNQAAINRFALYHKKKTGYSIEQLYQSICTIQEDTDVILEILEERGSWSGELYYQSSEGKRKRAQTTIIELKDEAGQLIGHLNIIRDSFRIQQQDNSSLQRIIEDLTERNETLQGF